jgi:hypothetical protein
MSAIGELEKKIFERRLDAAAERVGQAHRLILFVDRRAQAIDPVILAIPPSSAWHGLLPERQVVDVLDPWAAAFLIDGSADR